MVETMALQKQASAPGRNHFGQKPTNVLGGNCGLSETKPTAEQELSNVRRANHISAGAY